MKPLHITNRLSHVKLETLRKNQKNSEAWKELFRRQLNQRLGEAVARWRMHKKAQEMEQWLKMPRAEKDKILAPLRSL